ncbi:MAG: type II toxin-antitoxin system death-on-curing family toxin [Halofilum sp. (in: g-proteobacteria)]|nr:type II toxin-antitoxin system death-on-curing family toxin [Halofilum sp. (in: g-proteobacteria)]
MAEPVWIEPRLAEAIHDRQLSEHGGSPGVRDRAALESALARPRQLRAYGETDVDIPAMAAAYTFGIARNHPFVDGNKRTAYVVCRTFMILNGWDLVGPVTERYPVFLGVAAGDMAEEELVDWLRAHARPEGVNEPEPAYDPS